LQVLQIQLFCVVVLIRHEELMKIRGENQIERIYLAVFNHTQKQYI
jgi:hypothetical protein